MARCVPPQRHSFFMQPEMPRAKHDGGRRIHTSDVRRFCQCSPHHPVAPLVLSPVPFPPLRKLPANVVLLPELGNFRTRPRIFKWLFLLRLVTAATVEVPSQYPPEPTTTPTADGLLLAQVVGPRRRDPEVPCHLAPPADGRPRRDPVGGRADPPPKQLQPVLPAQKEVLARAAGVCRVQTPRGAVCLHQPSQQASTARRTDAAATPGGFGGRARCCCWPEYRCGCPDGRSGRPPKLYSSKQW